MAVEMAEAGHLPQDLTNRHNSQGRLLLIFKLLLRRVGWSTAVIVQREQIPVRRQGGLEQARLPFLLGLLQLRQSGSVYR